MNLLNAEQLTKVFTERKLLDHADFSIEEGEKIGVIGVNGTGKSTLLKLIAGLEEPDSGKITKGRNLTVRYLPQEPVFDKNATVMDAIIKDNRNALNEWSIEADAASAINRLGLPGAAEKIAQLSGGQRKRVALANAVLAPVDLLVLDEPTNHLDAEMAQWLEDYLTDFRGALVMVTHDRYFLDSISTRIIEIDHGRIYSYPGDYATYLLLKEQRQNQEIASERKRASLLRTELAWLSRGARARSTKQKAHIDRIRALQQQSGPIEEAHLELSSMGSRMGRTTIELDSVSKAYGEKRLIEDFTYTFLKHDRVGIVGPNGCGKSTLLNMICRGLEPDAGQITIGQTIRIGYFAQENSALCGSQTAIECVKGIGEYIHTGSGTISASQLLERFLFDKTMQWTRVEKLSGGEKRRLYLLRVLMSEPNVLVLDEPTNDLDIQTLEILEEYLDSFDGIVLTVSHDRYFLDRTVQRIFAFEGNGQLRQYEGNYSDYLHARPKPDAVSEASVHKSSLFSSGKQGKAGEASSDHRYEEDKTASPDSRSTRGGSKKLRFSFKEQKEYETIDSDIAGLEEKIASLESDMARYASDYGKLSQIVRDKDEAESLLEAKMERWVYLNELKEKIDAQDKHS
ncbi:MAG: ABC-F family ATP-binding cassette domain-containing protein [Lachnospiraceae bacterium]|nr:ABC-F family ATP-binding cassette domain-containing protein [Lachnospiraceae bacterium]